MANESNIKKAYLIVLARLRGTNKKTSIPIRVGWGFFVAYIIIFKTRGGRPLPCPCLATTLTQPASSVSIFIISVFTYLGGEVINNLPPFIKSGFRYLMPSLFGAVYMQLCLKHLKAGFITIILAAGAAFILKSFLHVHIIWLSLVCIAIGIVVTQMVEGKRQ